MVGGFFMLGTLASQHVHAALGVPSPCVGGQSSRWWTGAEAGDLLACLAAEGVLVRGCETGKAALEEFLQSSLDAYNNRFQLAHNRSFEGFTREEQHRCARRPERVAGNVEDAEGGQRL